MRESEEKIRSIVEFATDGITMTDEQGLAARIVILAQAQIVGLTHTEAIGKPLWDIQFQSAPIDRQTPALDERFKSFFQEVLASGKIPENLQDRETLPEIPTESLAGDSISLLLALRHATRF